MQITNVNQHHLEHHIGESYDPAWIPGYTQSLNELDLFEIETDEGITGYTVGQSFAGGLDYEEPLQYFLVGKDPHNVEKILRKLSAVNLIGPRPWHLEIALWDIIGKDAGKPIYELLGGEKREIDAYASTGEVQSAEERIPYIEKRVEEGFEAVKLRFSPDNPLDDLETARRIREEFPDLKLMVDANMGWRVPLFAEEERWSFREAVEVARGLEEIGGVEWLEEPLNRHNYRGLAELRSKTDIPISGGEFNNGIHTFREYIEHGSLDILQPDAVLSTGILNSKKVASMAELNGLEFAPHTWTNGVGLAANLHVMAATHAERCEYPLEPPAWTPDSRDFLLENPITPEDGAVTPPDEPGLGIEIDWEAVEETKK